MANEEHLRILKQGIEAWNEWREKNPDTEPDLRRADLIWAHLEKADLREVYLRGAKLDRADLGRADIRGADLRGAKLRKANLNSANLANTDIRGTDFKGAKFADADFSNAKAGLEGRFLLLRYCIFLLSSVYSGSLSFVPSTWLFLMIEDIFKLADRYTQLFISLALFISISSFLIMIIAIKGRKFYPVAMAMAMAETVAGTVAGTPGISVAVVVVVAIGVVGAVAGVMTVVGAGAVAGAGTLVIGAVVAAVSVSVAEIAAVTEIEIVTEAGIAILILILGYYIGLRALKGDEQFAPLRRLGLSLSSLGGTDFRNTDLQNAKFAAALLRNTRFDNETDLTNVCWKNSQKTELARFTGTIMENYTVRKLLVTHKAGDKSFSGLNLRGAYLRGADLDNADFTNADLRNADFTGAKITGVKLYGTSREDWIIDGVECDYVYWDRKGKERYPKEKKFAPGEFESLYKNISEIGEDMIERFIEFPPEYHHAGISILNHFGKVLKTKYPDTKAKIRIEQDDLKVKMTIVPVDGGDREIIEETLNEYGLVITGQMSPEEFTNDRPLIIELKSELRIAQARIETHKELLQDKSAQVDKLLSLVGKGIQSQPDITVSPTINVKQREERQTTAETIQGFVQAEKIDTHNQQHITGGRMGDDIKIKAGGDVAFAKDEAIAMINKKITEAAKITDSLEDKFNELSTAVENMVRDMPDEKAREVTGDLQTLVSEASKDQPRRKWYEISGEGLTDAAKAVGSLGKPVIDATQAVLKLLG
ncbi:pentapeptide repeat-containing protein [Desulfobacterales bacterium HSG2]|nr:pentapeptide repeat-containing protein [Desulfobacterales bacterium HSG2]